MIIFHILLHIKHKVKVLIIFVFTAMSFAIKNMYEFLNPETIGILVLKQAILLITLILIMKYQWSFDSFKILKKKVLIPK